VTSGPFVIGGIYQWSWSWYGQHSGHGAAGFEVLKNDLVFVVSCWSEKNNAGELQYTAVLMNMTTLKLYNCYGSTKKMLDLIASGQIAHVC